VAEAVYGSQFSADPYRGLYINQDEVNRLFSQVPCAPRLNPESAGMDEEQARLDQSILASPLLTKLSETFALTVFDLEVILLALAPELDLRYERLVAYLQDDVTRRRPSVDLALNLFCHSIAEKIERRTHFGAESVLVKQDLIQLIPDSTQSSPPLLAHYLKLDEQITNFLLNQQIVDSRLSSCCELRAPKSSADFLALRTEVKRALSSLILQARDSNQPLRIYFSGPCNADKHKAAEAISAEADLPLLFVDLNYLLTSETDVQRMLKRVFRLGWLQNTIVYLEGCDALRNEGRTLQAKALAVELSCYKGIAVLAGEQNSGLLETAAAESLGMIDVPFSIPGFFLRRECWDASLKAANVSIDDENVEVLAGRFRLTPSQISQTVVHAGNKAVWRAATAPVNGAATPEPTFSDFCSAARAQSEHQLGALARKIEPVYTWNDIVVPQDVNEQLRELCSRVVGRHRVLNDWGFGRKLSLGKGVSALFAGPSGTGKTMAAEIVANELALDLYKIDLSGIVSKYIGETEKNLERVFGAAEDSNAILFFDEADALFGKRSEVRDSHDRYANVEISYLLQRMEQYEGVSILATNRRGNLDEAFTRRLAFTVHFPFPDEVHRQRIWEQIWPPEALVDSSVDLEFLARRFKLSGGNIKNVALASAFLAAEENSPITMEHLIHAVGREYQKMGKPLTPNEMTLEVLEKVLS